MTEAESRRSPRKVHKGDKFGFLEATGNSESNGHMRKYEFICNVEGCGKVYRAAYSDIKRFNRTCCGCQNRKFGYPKNHERRLKELTNQQIGMLQISDEFVKDEGGFVRWVWCICDCGTKKKMLIGELFRYKRLNTHVSCGCWKRKSIEKNSKYMSGSVIAKKKRLALRRGWSFEIDADYIDYLWEEQDGKCYYSGKPLPIVKTAKESNAPSLDRLDSSKGYIPGNVVLCDWRVNVAKQTLSIEEFIQMCKDIVIYFTEKEKTSLPAKTNDIQADTPEHTLYSPSPETQISLAQDIEASPELCQV